MQQRRSPAGLLGGLSGRRNYETWLPSQNETSLLLKPLREHLRQKGVTFYSMKQATNFQCNAQLITGVTLQDGTTLTADAYAEMGRLADARETIKNILTILPNRTLAHVPLAQTHRNEDDRNRFLDALRKAGLPEG